MYGIGSLLSELFSSAASPAIGAAIKDSLGSELTKELASQGGGFFSDHAKLLGDIGGGAMGALAGAGVGAGLGALTGGGPGAAGGALTGGMGGAWGAYKADDIGKALGYNMAGQQSAPAQQAPTAPPPDQPLTGDIWQNQSKPLPNSGQPTALGAGTNQNASVSAPTGSQASAPPSSGADVNLGDYMDIAGRGAIPAFTFGSGLSSILQQNQWNEEEEKKRKYKEWRQEQKLKQLTGSLYNYDAPKYSIGGAVTEHVGTPEVPVTVRFPEWFVNDFAREGGVTSLMQQKASGGYVNLQPMTNQNEHPLGLVPQAAPFPASAPQRHEVIGMEDGGLIQGEGDGMSDDIPAVINGQEEVRVADGEYIVPRHIAATMEPKLKAMMTSVRSAAHAKHGKQIVENAAKRAFIQTMSGIKA